jgi:RNA polymerase sigma-70 factor (ECF subfamily)
MFLHELESPVHTSPDGIEVGAAFALDLAALSPFLLARALSLTGKRELSEDLVQETMTNAWQARRSFIPGTNLKAWLCKILRNEFFSHQRRAWRQAPWCTMFEETIPSPPGQQLSAIDLCEAACAMNALPDPQREALILVGVCGFSYEETALLLGGTLGTVKSRVARARLSLLNILQSRRPRRTKLHPAGSNAFDEWLVQLDQLRISACRILEFDEGKEARKLGAVPKIPLRAATTWDMTFAPAIVTAKPVADAVETFAASHMPAGTTMHGIVRGMQSLPYPLEEGIQEELAPAD